MSQQMPALSVVVVNWNSLEDLRACLASLRNQTTAVEVIVVDNGSSDDSVPMVKREFPEFELLEQIENLGFAQACNLGIEASHGAWVAMLNNDAIADPHWAEALCAEADRASTDCGMLQSLLLYQNRPNIINSAGIELAYSGGGRDRKEGQTYDPADQSPDEKVFCPTAGAAAYRRSMLDSIRLNGAYFDPVHFLYYEDMDLGWRARLAGWSTRYVPTSIVHHRWHGSSDRHGKTRLKVMANINRIRMLLKNASVSFILATLPRTLKEAAEIVRYGRLQSVLRLLTAIKLSLVNRRRITAMVRTPRLQVEREFRARPLRG